MKLLIGVLLVAALGLSGLYLWVINPWDWFVPQSPRFDVVRFENIEIGDEIDAVIDALGEPTRVNSHFGPCEGCVAYQFSGPPPDWLVGSTKAWVVADSEGRIVKRVHFREP